MPVYTAQKHFNDAEAYKKKGLLQEAIESYNKAIEADAAFVSAYYNLALVYYQTQQLSLAIVNLKKVTDLDSSDVSAFNNLGVLYVATGRLSDAKRCFENALAGDANYEEARVNLEMVRQKLQLAQSPSSPAQTANTSRNKKKLNVGFVSVWFERGQSYVTKILRDVIAKEHETFVFARTGFVFDIPDSADGRPRLETHGYWNVPHLTTFPTTRFPLKRLPGGFTIIISA